ncbi:MAG: aldose 1-epimerase [Clostridia bacterium]|nr:aldose 1-epimerase [Clostridia bacterium]
MLYEIKSKKYSATVDLSHGATLTSLKHLDKGINILRERGESIPDNPYLYGMPILFPVNRISGGKFTFEGRDYVFPINEPSTGCHLHGYIHALPFKLDEKGDSYLSAEFFSSDSDMYSLFPNSFKMSVTYRLDDCGLTLTVSISNLSDTNMPIMLGHHTTFSTELAGGEPLVFAEVDNYYERNDNYLPIACHTEKDETTLALRGSSLLIDGSTLSRHYRASGCTMALISKKRGLKIVYESDPIYRFRLIYSNSPDYVCLEPQTCLVDAPNANISYEESGFHYIAPQETKDYTSKIYLTEVI